MTISRIWRAFGLQAAPDRHLQTLARPVAGRESARHRGLVHEPARSRPGASACDEKSQIQALDRTQPLLPMQPGQLRAAIPTTTNATAPRHCLPLGKIAQPLLLIPDALPLAIAFDGGRIALPALAPVVGMAGAPFSAGILTNLAIFRIGGDLLAAAIGAPPPLALRTTADGLTGLKLRRLEDLLAIATTPFDHTGVVSLTAQADLETFIECVPRPRRWLFFQLQNRPNCGCFIPAMTG